MIDKVEFNKALGKVIRSQRTAIGLTQSSLAKILGITFQQVQKYENGANQISCHRLCEVAEALMTTPHALLAAAIDSPVTYESYASDRESLEATKAFNLIKRPMVRRRLADLARAIGEAETLEGIAA